MKILVLNAGSNSLKFEVIDSPPKGFGSKLIDGSYDDIGKPDSRLTLFENRQPVKTEPQKVPDYAHAAELLFGWLDTKDIERVGHRVVHGGPLFTGPAFINPEVISKIESLEDLAPLHNASALSVIRTAQEKLGASLPMIAVFDTVFHREIPDHAALYALPPDIADRHKIRRYGFHGPSHRYMSLRYAEIAKRSVTDLNLVTLHLEGGSSAAAIKSGKSIDTSMGFTPLEGLIMGTRTGDLDPAIVPFLMRKEHMNTEEIDHFLNTKCGLKGFSGVSSDTRELIKHLDKERVTLALTMFSYRVRKYIGSYLAVLGGADAIIFGGGISENTPLVRKWICKDLEWMGLTLDLQRNKDTVDREGPISTSDSRLQAFVIPSEEGVMVAYDTARCELP